MGSRTIGSLIVKLGFDPKEVDKGLKAFEKNLKDAGRRMESVGKTMSIGFTAPFLLGMRQAIKAYDEEATAVRKLEVALGRTSSALLTQAAAIQKTTTFADDAVINVQAYAAALGHSEEETKKMTSAAVNLAAGLGISLDSAMEMLHKSTLGAAKGLGNLLPGVKDLTKEQLKAGAAVDMVNEKFAGYAEQLAKTGAGPLKQFENRFGDLMEQFGEAGLPLLNKIIDKFSKLTEWFAKLSPETKEFVVEFGAFVAMAGPVLLMAGNIIKLAQSFTALATSMKAVALIGGGVFAAAGAIAGAESWAWNKFSPTGSGFAETIGNAVMKRTGGQYRSSQFGGTDLLLGSASQSQNTGFLAPPAAVAAKKGIEGITEAVKRLKVEVQSLGGTRLADVLLGTKEKAPMFAFDMNPALRDGGIANILPGNTSQTFGAGSSVSSGLTPEDFLVPDTSEGVASLEKLGDGWITLADTIGLATGMIDGVLKDGGKSFGLYALEAIKAAATIARAKMIEAAVNVVTDGAKGGLPGLLIGIAGASVAIGLIGKLVSGIKAPALAQGGLAYGPTTALVGDNPNARVDPEVISPLSKLKGMMTGGSNVQLSGVIRGNDIHLVTSREQGFAARRGSGNLITF